MKSLSSAAKRPWAQQPNARENTAVPPPCHPPADSRSGDLITSRLRFAHFCVVLFAFGISAWGQYSIDWSSVDGGGGTSTGGVYAVSGTIGQPDAGKMSGGNFTVDGGFWGVIAAVQTPSAPYLWVMLTPTNTVVVWWPLSQTPWQLQSTTNLPSGGNFWSECAYQTNGAACYRVESPPAGTNKFYRLERQQ